MDKDGLLSLDGFTKAYNKLIAQKKIVVTDEMVERQARKGMRMQVVNLKLILKN